MPPGDLCFWRRTWFIASVEFKEKGLTKIHLKKTSVQNTKTKQKTLNENAMFTTDLPDELPSLTPAPPKKSRFKASRVTFEEDDAEDRLDAHDTHISAVLSRIVVSNVL